MAESGDPNTSSAAEILATGEDCRAVIVQSQPLGTKNQRGDYIFAFVLTVMADGRPPYQVQVGNPVPADAVPLIYSGNAVPAKRLPDRGDPYIVIDWAEALLQATHGA
jgi:hypothetical protein